MRRPELLGYRARPVRDPASGFLTWVLECQRRCGQTLLFSAREFADRTITRQMTTLHEAKYCVSAAGIQQHLSNEHGDHVWLWVVILGGMPVVLLIAWGVIRLTLR